MCLGKENVMCASQYREMRPDRVTRTRGKDAKEVHIEVMQCCPIVQQIK